jgi:hypothetical protein
MAGRSSEMNATYAPKKLDHQFILNVKFEPTKELHVRMWIALRLIKLATIILGCGIKVEQ